MSCYGENLNRNIIFLKGLKTNNVDVYEYNVNSHSITKNLILFIKNLKKLKRRRYDLILFHSEAFIQYPLAKLLSFIKQVPIVHDIFISKLQTIYEDRKQFKKRKIPKMLFRIILFSIDLIECKLSDYIILDTYSHIKFFHEKFHVPIKKFIRILVGSQNDVFFPIDKYEKKDDVFIVGFCGTYIPLQGIKYIIEAAKLLENDKRIKFILIGRGQTFENNRNLARKLKLNNIVFKGLVPLEELPKFKSEFDIELGIFGDSNKALQIIPNKIYDGIAMKMPMITCNSPAIRELFTDNENIVLCEKANPKSLAEAILKLKNNRDLRQKISDNAYELYLKYCTIEAIGKSLKSSLNNIIKKEKR
ncbi:MAG: glycosyltransferase family 4 protein [Promethearchaeota archaeon]